MNNINTRKLTRSSIHKHIHTNILKYTYFWLTFFRLKTHGLTCNINMSSMPSKPNTHWVYLLGFMLGMIFNKNVPFRENVTLYSETDISRFKPFYFLFLMFTFYSCSFIICCNYLLNRNCNFNFFFFFWYRKFRFNEIEILECLII